MESASGSGSSIDPSDPQGTDEQTLLFEFARSLQENHDYARAITEYQRHLSYYPDSDYRPVVERNLLRCYYEAGQYRQAIGYGESVLGNASHPESDEIRFYVGAASFKRTDYVKAEFYFGELGRENGPSRDKAQMAQGLTLAYELEWEKSWRLFEQIDDTSAYSIKALGCARLAREGANLKYKDPTLAGVAAIIPGLGYLYAGYPKTALSAFVVNALFIWGTYEAFRNDLPGLGATLAVFGIGWYSGNIYGSVTSAKRRNMKMRYDHLIEFDIGYEF
jgi:tetratricopeptide (TPR) repeat protein